MRTSRLAILLSLLSGAALGDELAPGQVERLRAAVESLRKVLASGDLTAEKAWALGLKELSPEELELAPESTEVPDDLRAALRHVCRTAALRRGPLGRLGKARDICYLLGSPRDEDWRKAFRLLRREPFSDDLDRAVIALGKDGRPEVRLLAARLASSLVVFGRKAEGLTDAVLACLMDPHPNVVAALALSSALDTRDKCTIDRLVASLKDDRALDPLAPRLLNMGTSMTLGERVQHQLSWTFWQERCARVKFEPPRFDGAGNALPRNEPVYVLLSPDEIRAWWKENRETFGFGTPAPQWRCVFDDVLHVDVGKRLVVAYADGRPLKIDLKVYREHWLDGEPVTTVEGEIHDDVAGEESYVAGLGNPDHADGYVSWERATWGNGEVFGEVVCEAAFLPTDKPGRVRMKLTMHIGHVGQ